MSLNLNKLIPENLRHSHPAVWATKRYYELRNHKLEKLFFTATTGRSGTTSLTEIFKAVPDSVSYHEPYPIMNEQWLERASNGDEASVNNYFKTVKSVYIRRGAIGSRYYLEANHLFLKTFISPAIEEFGKRLEIIHLVRPAIEVSNSIYRIGNWPGTHDGDKWWLSYRAQNNVIGIADLLDNDTGLAHPFYKALWYWYETEARVARYKALYPRVKFHDFSTTSFNDFEKVCQLFNDLGVCYDRNKLSGLIGTKANDIVTKKGKEGLELKDALRMKDSFERVLESRGMLGNLAVRA
jgi:hypothetical protein